MLTIAGGYFRDVFSVGKSAQSLISDIIDIIRTFQKMSAPNTFYYHISKDFQKMFKWASDLIEIICNICGHPNFSELHQFVIFTFVFPLSISTFISVMILGLTFYLHFFMIIISVAFPVGIFLITYKLNIGLGIGFIIGSIALLAITIVLICKFGFLDVDADDIYLFTLSFLSAFTVLVGALTLCLYDKESLSLVLVTSISIFVFLTLVVEYFVHYFGAQSDSACYKAIGLAINIYSLIVIPSTKSFFLLISDPNCIKWNIITAYVLNTIVLPIVFTIVMIVTEHPDLCFRYRDFCYFFFELFDQLKQVAYIFCAEFNEYWGCISLEMIWFIAIFVFRPYSAISDYVLEASNSFVLMISNGLLFKTRGEKNELFNIPTQIAFFVMGIVPAIVAFYCYFIFDFKNKEHDEDKEFSLTILGQVMVYGVPVVWIFTALNFKLWSYLIT